MAVLSPGGTPTVANDPLLLGCLANYCYRVVEVLFWAISKRRRFYFSIGWQLPSSYHRSNYIPLCQLILYPHTVIFRQIPKPINFIFLYLRVIHNLLPAIERMPILRSIRIILNPSILYFFI
jgi:hypothetical protein